MAVFEGDTVMTGVMWTVTPDLVVITCYPSSLMTTYKLTKKAWVNRCNKCGKEGTLYCHGTNESEVGSEGVIKCSACYTEFCGVTGDEI